MNLTKALIVAPVLSDLWAALVRRQLRRAVSAHRGWLIGAAGVGVAAALATYLVPRMRGRMGA